MSRTLWILLALLVFVAAVGAGWVAHEETGSSSDGSMSRTKGKGKGKGSGSEDSGGGGMSRSRGTSDDDGGDVTNVYNEAETNAGDVAIKALDTAAGADLPTNILRTIAEIFG